MPPYRRSIIAINIPFFYVQHAVQKLNVPENTPLAVERNGHIIDLSPTALMAGAMFGLPLRALRHAVPGLVIIPAESATSYFSSGESAYAACAEFTPVVEPLQPDLILADLGYNPIQLSQLVTTLARACSKTLLVGCANTRWVALCAVNHLVQDTISNYQINSTELNDGTSNTLKTAWLEVTQGNESTFLASLTVNVLISAPLKEPDLVIGKLNELGVTTLGELAQISVASLIQQFGLDSGRKLYQLARGQDRTPIHSLYPPDKVTVHFQAPAESAGFCDTSSIDQVLMHLCTQLADLLFARGQAASELSLDITTRAGIECVHKSLKHPTMQKENLLRLARQMYAQTKPQTIVLAVALSSDNLVVPPFTQGDIFTDNAGVADGIVRAMQSVHSRFGSHAVQKAGQLPHTRRELVRMLWEGNNL